MSFRVPVVLKCDHCGLEQNADADAGMATNLPWLAGVSANILTVVLPAGWREGRSRSAAFSIPPVLHHCPDPVCQAIDVYLPRHSAIS